MIENMVRPERFELPASSSGGKRSIQLSYGRLTPVYMECMASSILGCCPSWRQKKAGTIEKKSQSLPPSFATSSPGTLRQFAHRPKPLQNTYQAVSSAVQEQTPWPLPNRIKNWHSVSRSLASKVV
jgi:hypothetical protein